MSKMTSITKDLDELHDLTNELYEALSDSELDEAAKICDRAIKKYKSIKFSIC